MSQLNRKHKVYTKKELNALKSGGGEPESLSELVSKIDANSQLRTEATSATDEASQPRRRSTRSASNKVAEAVVPLVKLKESDIIDSPAIIIDSSANRYQLRAARNSPFIARSTEEEVLRASTPQMRLSVSPKKEMQTPEKPVEEVKSAFCALKQCWMEKCFYSGYLRYSYAEVALFVFVTLVAFFGLVSLAGLVNVASPLEAFKSQIEWISNSVCGGSRALLNSLSEACAKAVDSVKSFVNKS